jgi:hypothetical protein
MSSDCTSRCRRPTPNETIVFTHRYLPFVGTGLELASLFVFYGLNSHFAGGDDQARIRQLMATTLDSVLNEITAV